MAALRVLEEEEVGLAGAYGHGPEPEVPADPVILVDDEVADREVGEGGEGRPPLVARAPERPPPSAEQLLLGQEHDSERGHGEAARALPDDHRESLRPPERVHRGRLQEVLAQDLAQAVSLVGVARGQPDAGALADPACELPGQLAELAVEPGDRVRVEVEVGAGRLPAAPGRRQEPELEALPIRQQPRERHRGGGVFRRGVEELGLVEDDRRPGRQIREQVGGGLGPAERQQRHLREGVRRSLGRRIEEADRLDLVAEQLDPDGAPIGRPEHVDDPPAHAPLAHLGHGVGALVAGPLERLQEELPVEAVADAQTDRRGPERRRVGQRLRERGRRGHHGQGLVGQEPVTDDGAGRVRLALAPAPQPRLGRRKLHRPPAEEAQVARPPLRLGEARDQHEARPGVGLEEGPHDERARRPPEARRAQADVSPGPGPGQRLVRGPILE